jgi:hypothetical protein
MSSEHGGCETTLKWILFVGAGGLKGSVMSLQKWTTKNLLLSALILGTISTASGQVALEVYEADEVTPFDCNDQIMVGTKLTLIVSSDSNDFWNGGLFIAGQDRNLGTLAGRDLDPNTRDWTGSHYSDAGDFAKVTQWNDSSIWGFDFFTFYPVDGNSEDNSTVAGDWFVIDYYADDVGECNVGFYDYDLSWEEPNWLQRSELVHRCRFRPRRRCWLRRFGTSCRVLALGRSGRAAQ